MSPTPRHPDISVHLSGLEARPAAAIALVRRTLQRAGQTTDARAFTEDALASEPDRIFAIAGEYVVVH